VPDTDEDGVSEGEKARGVVNSIRSIFGIRPTETDVELLTPAGERRVVRAKAPLRGSANLLLKMKRQKRKTEGSESLDATANDFVCHDIIQKKGT
jgi:hypothetical protein